MPIHVNPRTFYLKAEPDILGVVNAKDRSTRELLRIWKGRHMEVFKRILRSAVVGLITSAVTGMFLGIQEHWLLGAGVGVTHYSAENFMRWLFTR